jgi:hypothetical protein
MSIPRIFSIIINEIMIPLITTSHRSLPFLLVEKCRRFETGGSLGRRVSVAACPSPDGSSARASAKEGERGDRRPA